MSRCPFCGHKFVVTFHWGFREIKPWAAECMNCGARGPWADTDKDALERWKRRASP